jgi:hypothetical protein
MNSTEAQRRAEALFKRNSSRGRPSKQRPTTTPRCTPCEKRPRGCGHSGWLAMPLVRAGGPPIRKARCKRPSSRCASKERDNVPPPHHSRIAVLSGYAN